MTEKREKMICSQCAQRKADWTVRAVGGPEEPACVRCMGSVVRRTHAAGGALIRHLPSSPGPVRKRDPGSGKYVSANR